MPAKYCSANSRAQPGNHGTTARALSPGNGDDRTVSPAGPGVATTMNAPLHGNCPKVSMCGHSPVRCAVPLPALAASATRDCTIRRGISGGDSATADDLRAAERLIQISGSGASVLAAGPSSLVACDTLVVSGVASPCDTSNSRSASSAMAFSTAASRLDLLDAFARQVGGHADPGAVLVDLILENLLGLPEVGRHVEMKLGGQRRHLGLGPAHLQLGVVLGDLVLDVVELLDGVLNLEQVVLISLLMKGQLLLVLGRVVLGPLAARGQTSTRCRGRPRSSRP